MRVVLYDGESNLSICRAYRGESPEDTDICHRNSVYKVTSVVEKDFLYILEDQNGKRMVIWHCYGDLWVGSDPVSQHIEAYPRVFTNLEYRVIGYYGRRSNSFAYYVNKNACSFVSSLYCGVSHGLESSYTCSVIRDYQIPTIDLSHVRKWIVWRSAASRCASCADMIYRRVGNGSLLPKRMRDEIMSEKSRTIGFCTGVARAMTLIGLHLGDVYGATTNPHLSPQHSIYVSKGVKILGVDDVVMQDSLPKYVEQELGETYTFKSTTGKNSGRITEEDIRSVPGFSIVEKADDEFLAYMTSHGASVFV